MHNASGKHLQAGLLALDADQSPSRSPRSEQWLMTEGNNVHHSGASASDSHRLPFAELIKSQQAWRPPRGNAKIAFKARFSIAAHPPSPILNMTLIFD
jgi:hypothetical protein